MDAFWKGERLSSMMRRGTAEQGSLQSTHVKEVEAEKIPHTNNNVPRVIPRQCVMYDLMSAPFRRPRSLYAISPVRTQDSGAHVQLFILGANKHLLLKSVCKEAHPWPTIHALGFCRHSIVSTRLPLASRRRGWHWHNMTYMTYMTYMTLLVDVATSTRWR